MSAAGLDRRLLVPRPGRLLLRMGLGVLLPAVLLAVSARWSGQPAMALFCVLFMVAQIAVAVTTAHKEIMAASPSFFQPGLRRGVLTAQAAWALVPAIGAAVLLGLLHPGFTVLRAATALGAALGVYALLALATLQFCWAFQIPVWMFYLWPLAAQLDLLARQGRLDGVMDSPLLWLAAAALLLFALARRLVSPQLYRKLHGTFVLGSDDLFRPGRIVAYKQQRGLRSRPGQGPAWRRRLIDQSLQRAAAAGLRGRTTAARVWQMQALGVAATVSLRVRVLAILAVGMLAMMLFFGYYDSKPSAGFLDHWFAGLIYQFALWPFFALPAVLLAAPMSSLSRGTGLRSETVTIGLMTVLSFATALPVAALFAALAAILPPLDWRGCELAFAAPRLHGIWLMPMLAPFAWLTVALRPRPHSMLPNFVVGPMFIIGHALMNVVPYRDSVPIFAAASLVALVAAYLMRRRWWRSADHA